ncbi:MAG: hypothetical protein C4336_05160 [Armatimonadota bacterium]|mgnify:FL=1
MNRSPMHCACTRWKRGLLLALWLCLSRPPTDAQDWTRPPSVVVLLYVQSDGSHLVSWTFDRRIPHEQVRARVGQFAYWSQHLVAHLEIADDSLKRNAKPNELFTSASFTTGGLVNLREGTIDLTPIVRTFADLPVIHVYTALPHEVTYAGYTHYETPHLTMWTQAEPRLWRTMIYVHTADPKLLQIPLKRLQPQPQVVPKDSGARSISPWWIVLLIASALLIGIGIFWSVSYLLKRQNETEAVQSNQTNEIGG